MKRFIRLSAVNIQITSIALLAFALFFGAKLHALDKKSAKEGATETSVDDDKLIEMFEDLDTAVNRARLSQRPLLVVFGADWCGWCRKLEGEIASEQGEEILKTWVVVKINIDKQTDLAIDYGVSGVPALRVLDLENIAIAGTDGYVPVEQLKEWLQEQMAIANPKIQRVLYAQGDPSLEDLNALLEFLGHRTPSLRNAAAERLTRSRELTAQAVVETFRTGKLGQQLTTLQILKAWNAPVDGLDPWSPDSIDEISMQPLLDWLTQLPKVKKPEQDPQAPPALEASQAEKILSTLTNSPSETSMSEAVRLGDSLLPHVATRLAASSELDDTTHETLRELNYRLLSGDKLRLTDSALLKSLASLNTETHRAAAEKTLPKITSQDQPLLDALSNDLNPIIRERSIAIQQKLGGLQAIDRLQRLLADSSPSVRTAVLRELSEHPDPQSITALIAYLHEETDENLLVYATKTLGTIGAEKRAIKDDAETALVDLAKSQSWRVRAAAIDAIGQTFEKARYGNTTKVSTTLAKAVLEAINDEDPFVVSRAEPFLMRAVNSKTVEDVTKYLMSHLDRLKDLTKEISEYEKEKTFAPIVQAAEVFLHAEKALEIRNAATLITRLKPEVLQSHLPKLIASDDSETRIAAYEAFIASLNTIRESAVKSEQDTIDHESIDVQPWYDVPESFKSLPTETKSRLTQEDAKTPDRPSGLNLFSLFFGGSSTPAKPNSSLPQVSKSREQDTTDPSTEKKSKGDDLSVVDDFFGSAPSPNQSPTKAEPDAEVTELKSEASEPTQPDEDSLGLPSRWLTQWQHSDSFRQSFVWINPIQVDIRKKLGEISDQLDSRSVEHQWLNAIAMTTGDTQRSNSVARSFRSSRENASTESMGLPPNLLLSWLAVDDRRRWIVEQTIDWKNLTQADHAFLKSATEIDDLQIADWILEGMNDLPEKKIAAIQPYLNRALFGPKADSLNEHIYESSSRYQFNEKDAVPGKLRAEKWLRAKYHDSSNDDIRSLLLSTLSFVDHNLAVASAVGFVAQANQGSTLLDVAVELALHDKIEVSVDRAIQWLDHPIIEVQNHALRRLGKTASDTQSSFETDIQSVTVWQFNGELPGVWYHRRPLPKQTLETLSKQETDEAILAKIILLAIKDEASPEPTIESAMNTEATRLLLCVSLSLAERVDPEAIRIYRQTSESLSEQRNVQLFYSVLKDLTGDEVRAIRTELRNKFGSTVAEPF